MKIKLLSLLLICFIWLYAGTSFATESAEYDVNGVTVIDYTYTYNYGFYVEMFDAFDVTSTSYVCNSAGGTADSSGQLDTKHINSSILLYIDIPTLNSTSITARAFGRNTGATWAVLDTMTYTAATDGPQAWPILERPKDFRVCVKVANDVSGDVLHIDGHFMSERVR